MVPLQSSAQAAPAATRPSIANGANSRRNLYAIALSSRGPCVKASYRPFGRACTIRAAIQEANALGGAHTIVLPSGTYTLSLLTGDYYVDATSDASGSLKIFEDVTLSGAGAFTTSIDGNHLS